MSRCTSFLKPLVHNEPYSIYIKYALLFQLTELALYLNIWEAETIVKRF
jgi:hypothetical protein